ncbi:MAG: hypothetical protein Q9160_007631 [Pyrenula sp. 1 TL-2023]
MAYGGEKGVPFHQAWMMSGPPGTALNMTSDATEIHTTAVAEKLGCEHSSDKKVLSCLRSVPMQKLIDTAMEYSIANHPPVGVFTFIPSIDDDFFPDRQSNLYRAGKFVKGIPMIFGWTQDDGAMNTGPAFFINSESDMIAPIRNFAHVLSSTQLQHLFSRYAEEDFVPDLAHYNARKSPSDPEVSVHYFRASRILRDLLFTCSSIDYARHMALHTRASGAAAFDAVRLYALNQSVLTPLFEATNMPYVGVAHGSDTHYVFNGVFPEGEVTEKDQVLARDFTRALINFAYTGNPNPQARDGTGWGEWPAAFSHPQPEDGNDEPDTEPKALNIQVIGGPYGTGPVALPNPQDDYASTSASTSHLPESEQAVLQRATDVDSDSNPSSPSSTPSSFFSRPRAISKMNLAISSVLDNGFDFDFDFSLIPSLKFEWDLGAMRSPFASSSSGSESVAETVRKKQAQREAEVKREKLFERCEYINSLTETLGI